MPGRRAGRRAPRARDAVRGGDAVRCLRCEQLLPPGTYGASKSRRHQTEGECIRALRDALAAARALGTETNTSNALTALNYELSRVKERLARLEEHWPKPLSE